MSLRLLLFTGCLLLSSCEQAPSGADALETYIARLSGATEVAATPLTITNRWEPPKASHGTIPAAEQIDLIDFLSLSGCKLQINLGRRNSQLGRSASPSQRLILDLEFMHWAPACARFLREQDNAALAATIERASEQRQRWLPMSIREAVLAGPEWESFWSTPTTLNHYPQETDSTIVQTLTQLTQMVKRWLGGDWLASNRDFELLLSELRAGDGGALLLSMDQVAQQLTRANNLLTRANREKPLCPFGRQTDRSRAVEAVVQRFFVGEVQPWLVQLRQRKELLSASIAALEAPLMNVQSEQYRDWARRRDALLESQGDLIRNHVHVIQQVLSHCGSA